MLVNFYRVKKENTERDGKPMTEWRYSAGKGKAFIRVTLEHGTGQADVERIGNDKIMIDKTTVPLGDLLTELTRIDETWRP